VRRVIWALTRRLKGSVIRQVPPGPIEREIARTCAESTASRVRGYD
jgi:hypothetical protein